MLIRSPAADPVARSKRRRQPPRFPPIPLEVLPPPRSRTARDAVSSNASSPNASSPNAIAHQLTGRDYLSYSAISTYQRCSLKYFFMYVMGAQPEFKSASLIFGGAIHGAIEQHFRCLFAGQASPTLDELLAEFDRTWNADATVPVRYGKNETTESLRDLAERMLATFQADEVSKLDTFTPSPGKHASCSRSPNDVSKLDTSTRLIGVEEELRAPIVDDCPDILGRVDLVTTNPNALVITDFKTARTAWSAAQIAEAAPQQLLYAELAQPLAQALGCRKIEICWVVITKGKQPVVSGYNSNSHNCL